MLFCIFALRLRSAYGLKKSQWICLRATDLFKGRRGVFFFMLDIEETISYQIYKNLIHWLLITSHLSTCAYLPLSIPGDWGPFIIADTSVNASANVNANTSDTSLYEEYVAYHSHQHDMT